MTLNERGADVVFQVAGNAGQGVFAAAKEKGFYAIGVDQDQKITAKEFDSQIICSMLKDIGGSIYDVISAFIEDESWAGGTVKRLDMSDGYVSIGYGNDDSVQQVSDAVKAEANEITNKIISGEIAVNTAMQ